MPDFIQFSCFVNRYDYFTFRDTCFTLKEKYENLEGYESIHRWPGTLQGSKV